MFWWKVKLRVDVEEQVVVVIFVVVVVVKFVFVLLLCWMVKKGEYFFDVLICWGKKVGYIVILEGFVEWKFGVCFVEVGIFENVVEQFVKGFVWDGLLLLVCIYLNKVLKIGLSL